MKIAPLPDDEDARLAELTSYHLLDTQHEEAFDDLTVLAAQICGTLIALVSLIDVHPQWFKSKVGIDRPDISRDIAFCAHTFHGKDLFVVPDAAHDERFADTPLVTTAPNIRFYAGIPIITPSGHAIGTLCVMDQIARELTNVQQDALRRLGRQAVNLILLGHYIHQAHTPHADKKHYQILFESSRDAIMTLAPPTWRFTSGNPATVRMFHTQDEAEFISLGPWELSPEQQPDGRLSADKAREMIETAMREGSHFFLNGRISVAQARLFRRRSCSPAWQSMDNPSFKPPCATLRSSIKPKRPSTRVKRASVIHLMPPQTVCGTGASQPCRRTTAPVGFGSWGLRIERFPRRPSSIGRIACIQRISPGLNRP